jgi:mannose-1-phosphate guanylyltransferase
LRAMVLAAGLGTRLRPHTLHRPKPLLPLMDQPLLYWVLHKLQHFGVSEVVVNAHHLSEQIEEDLAGSPVEGLACSVSVEHPMILGTAGGLKAAEDRLRGAGTLLMVNSDSLHTFDLSGALRFHQERGALATMVLFDGPGSADYPTVGVDREGRIVRLADRAYSAKEPARAGCFTGIHIFEEAIFDLIPLGRPWEINAQVYPRMLTEGRSVCGWFAEGFWSDLGTPERLLDGACALLGGCPDPHAAGYAGPLTEAAGWFPERAERTVRGATVRGPSFVSPAAELGKDALAGPHAIISAGAQVGRSSVVREALLFPWAVIEAEEEVTEIVR